jgi:hypothetical protein
MKLITHMKSNYTNTLTRCGVIIRGNVHISAVFVLKHVHSFNIVYILRETDIVNINKFIRLQLKCDGTWRRTGGEVQGKLANGAGS